ncbi:MAG: hypothetical protein ACYCXG_03495 [Acidiferrobacter sp.]
MHDVDVLETLSHSGWRGGAIPAHRALRIMGHEQGRLLASLALGPLFTALIVALIPTAILPLWAGIERFWCQALPGRIAVSPLVYRLPWGLSLAIPVPMLNAGAPSPLAMLLTAGLALGMVIMALIMRRRRIPLALALYSLAAVLTIDLLAFTPVLAPFPYEVAGYVQSMLMAGLILVAIVPLMLMLIYYPLDFSFLKKIGLTVLAIVWLVISLPAQFMLQAVVIHHLSLVAMAPLFLFTGLLLDVMGVVALYSWGMSWRLVHER